MFKLKRGRTSARVPLWTSPWALRLGRCCSRQSSRPGPETPPSSPLSSQSPARNRSTSSELIERDSHCLTPHLQYPYKTCVATFSLHNSSQRVGHIDWHHTWTQKASRGPCLVQGRNCRDMWDLIRPHALVQPTSLRPSTIWNWSCSANSASLAPPTHNTIARPFPLQRPKDHEQNLCQTNPPS